MDIKRKNIRLAEELYEVPSQVFSITICTRNRNPSFSNQTWAKLLLSSLETGPLWKQTEQFARCLMPDHLHLLISPREGNLADLINGWKSFSANLLRQEGLREPLWQRGFFDHALRREEDIEAVANYIVNNPVRAGLVKHWEDYPYSWQKWM